MKTEIEIRPAPDGNCYGYEERATGGKYSYDETVYVRCPFWIEDNYGGYCLLDLAIRETDGEGRPPRPGPECPKCGKFVFVKDATLLDKSE